MDKIIIANWKSHPSTLEEAKELFEAEVLAAEQNPNVQIVICPPTNFLEHLSLGALGVGAQDVFWQLPDSKPLAGISHVLVGHSDRRYGLGETDEEVNQKIKMALESDIIPVLLVGEKEKGRRREDILAEQITKDLKDLTAEQVSGILFCYEPVWAISTNAGGQADSPENALEAIKFIREFVNKKYALPGVNCLYGGSVNENNVADFLRRSEIDGAIVGAASLDAGRFSQILEIASGLQPS